MSDMEQFKKVKSELATANAGVDIINSSIFGMLFEGMIQKIPGIGPCIYELVCNRVEEFQKEKQKILIDTILENHELITLDMVNDIGFIVNVAKVNEAVERLTTNEKVRYFGNLIRNGYLSGKHIDEDEFTEYLEVLKAVSYREIRYLVMFKNHCDKDESVLNSIKWRNFKQEYLKHYVGKEQELYSAFQRLKRTGFVYELYEAEGGELDGDMVTDSTVEGQGFALGSSFQRFYEYVLKTGEQ